jgi:hypothetical protein
MTSKQLISSIAAAGSLLTGGIVNNAQLQAQDDVINPYIENVDSFETRVNANKVLVHKDKPKITLEKWNNKDSLGVSYSKTKKNGKTSRKQLTKITEYQVSNKESVVMEPTVIDVIGKQANLDNLRTQKANLIADIQSNPGKYLQIATPDGLIPATTTTAELIAYKTASYDEQIQEAQTALITEDGFNIDINLNSKPSSNVFTYQFENWEDKDFFYQPPLNQEIVVLEGDQGQATCTETDCYDKNGNVIRHRPETVVGSYAVYSKDKKNHILGQTNYQTGKLFHIYRPLVSDVNGSTTWATLNITDGVMTVTVPQQFLDSADYPVLVDPTIGFTGLGGSSDAVSSSAKMRGTVHNSPGTGTVDSISLYVTTASSRTFKGVIIDTIASPAIITNGVSPASAGTGIVTNTLVSVNYSSKPSITNGVDYGLCIIMSGSWTSKYDSSGNTLKYVYDDSNSYTTPAAPAAGEILGPLGGIKYSIYATYTASGGGSTTPARRILIIE